MKFEFNLWNHKKQSKLTEMRMLNASSLEIQSKIKFTL